MIGHEFSEAYEASIIQGYLERWYPVRTVKCTNCQFSRVYQEINDRGKVVLMVDCRKGHGKKKPWVSTIKPQHAAGPGNARTCGDFASMDDPLDNLVPL